MLGEQIAASVLGLVHYYCVLMKTELVNNLAQRVLQTAITACDNYQLEPFQLVFLLFRPRNPSEALTSESNVICQCQVRPSRKPALGREIWKKYL